MTPNRLLETQTFEKKAVFSVIKIIWPIFARSIQNDVYQGTFYKGQQGILTSTVEVIISTL